jgi:hypothetical protein
MINKFYLVMLLSLTILAGCNKGTISSASDSTSFSDRGASGGSSNPGGGQAGVVTAGEWNDLDHWLFWDTLINKDDFKKWPSSWGFFNANRIAVNVAGPNALPVVNALVTLKRNGATIFSTKTDNKGNAELWVGLFQNDPGVDFSKLTIDVNNGAGIITRVKPWKEGINNLIVLPAAVNNKIEIAFVVDATGSMGDEIGYLKTELLDVITRVKKDNASATLATSAVFYRDKNDDYLTKVSAFSTNINTTIDFIKGQNAGGGGDFPEAVHSAMEKAVNELQWSANARTRLVFLLLDAPPHHEEAVISSLQGSVKKAIENGIKIIPITASGIDKETEFLMRFMAISTNSTYVFITNHSGIGNDHLTPTVGPYEVEYLNNLMVRLINKYAQ